MLENTIPSNPNTIPHAAQAETSSIPSQIINHTYSTAKEMGKSYAYSTAILGTLQYLGVAEQATRLNYSAFGAISTPIRPRVSLFYQKLLGCNENTPIRNITSHVASTFTSIAVTGAVCQELGYNVNTMDIINAQITGFKYAAYAVGACFGITLASHIIADRCFGVSLMDDEIQGEETELPPSDRQAVIKPLTETSAVKTQRVKQSILDQQ